MTHPMKEKGRWPQKILAYALSVTMVFSLMLGSLIMPAHAAAVDILAFDEDFLQTICDKFDLDPLGFDESELAGIDNLDVSGCNLSSLDGLHYFTSLETLICSDNNLDILPALPAALTYLDCGNNNLTALPALPGIIPGPGLETLICGGNLITDLSAPMPATLTHLDCGNNPLSAPPFIVGPNPNGDGYTYLDISNCGLTDVPAVFPGLLTYFDCSGNPLGASYAWPALPGGLEYFNCGDCGLDALPVLPGALLTLNCSGNDLSGMDFLDLEESGLWALPGSLTALNMSGCNLTDTPWVVELPLTALDVSDNGLTALPILPDTLETLDCSGNLLTSLDLSRCPNLTTLDYSGNPLTDVTVCAELFETMLSELGPDPVTLAISGTVVLSDVTAIPDYITLVVPDGATLVGYWLIDGDIVVEAGGMLSWADPPAAGAYLVGPGAFIDVTDGTLTVTANGEYIEAYVLDGDAGINAVDGNPFLLGAYGADNTPVSQTFTVADGGTLTVTDSGADLVMNLVGDDLLGQGYGMLILGDGAALTVEEGAKVVLGNGALIDASAAAVTGDAGIVDSEWVQIDPVDGVYTGGATAFVISPDTLPDGTVGTPYTASVQLAWADAASTAALPEMDIAWSLDGQPGGIVIEDGELSGTPTASGEYTFTVTATVNDTVILATRAYTITINPPPSDDTGTPSDDTGTPPDDTETPPDDTETPPSLPFFDVYTGDWFFDAVRFVYDEGLMTGTGAGKFSPDVPLTRGMIVTILHRLDGQPRADGDTDFSDVPAGAYYAEAVAWAAGNGVALGYGDGTFRPDTPVTREQIAVFLCRYAAYKGLDTSAAYDLSGLFADASGISQYAENAMAWAVRNDIIRGYPDGTVRPQNFATRAEAATLIMRFQALL